MYEKELQNITEQALKASAGRSNIIGIEFAIKRIQEKFDLKPKEWTLLGKNGLLQKNNWDIQLCKSVNRTYISIYNTIDNLTIFCSSDFSELNSLHQSVDGELTMLIKKIINMYQLDIHGLPSDFEDVVNKLVE